jgi:Raf kinase inhibitor-like YbhB/YbcL family protein
MKVPKAIIIIATTAVLVLSCIRRPQSIAQQPNANEPKEDKMGIKLTSAAFKEGQAIPRAYTCDGANVAPPLEWSGVPASAKTLAIICDDPDAPSGTWVHWVFYNLPANKIGLVENTPTKENLAGGGTQGTNSSEKIGYDGPCPPGGTHHYFFKLYALDGELSLKARATKAELLKAMEGHIVAQGQLMGTYER